MARERKREREGKRERESNSSYARGTRAKSPFPWGLIEARDDALSATFALIFPPVHRLPPSSSRGQQRTPSYPLRWRVPAMATKKRRDSRWIEQRPTTHYWFWLLLLRRWIIAIAPLRVNSRVSRCKSYTVRGIIPRRVKLDNIIIDIIITKMRIIFYIIFTFFIFLKESITDILTSIFIDSNI